MRNVSLITLTLVVLNGYSESHADIFLFDGLATKQIATTNQNDLSLQISGSNVVWHMVDRFDTEIYLYDGNVRRQLTDNSFNDELPQVSGSNVVWQSPAGIFLFNGETTREVTLDGREPLVSGSNVIWSSGDDDEIELFLYDGSTTIQLTDNDVVELHADISGSRVVWDASDGNDREIFLHDGSMITQLSRNGIDDIFPHISDSRVVWETDSGIFLYDGTIKLLSTAGTHARISESNVVWQEYDGNDREIFLFDGSSTTRLTNNSFDDLGPEVSGSNVAWTGWDGHDWEILLHDGFMTTQLTDNNFDDVSPQISGSNVVWEAVVPEPSTFGLVTCLTCLVSGRRRSDRR